MGVPGRLVGNQLQRPNEAVVRQLPKGYIPFRPSEEWLHVAGASEAGGGLASSPLAMPAFFAGWIGVGVLVGLRLARRGHDRRTMVALGAGLGPLMFVVASDAATRERQARPLVLEPGVNHGGSLDLLVLVQERAEDVRSIGPTLEAVASDIGSLTLACAVPYEWMEGDSGEEVEAASSKLVAARDLLPIAGARLVMYPGTAAAVARRFSAQENPTVVLAAIAEDDSSTEG